MSPNTTPRAPTSNIALAGCSAAAGVETAAAEMVMAAPGRAARQFLCPAASREGLNKGLARGRGPGGCSPATVRSDWGRVVPFWDVCTLISGVADTLRPLAA